MINRESSIDSSQKNFIIDHELTHINQNHTNNFNSMIKSRIKIMRRSKSALPARLKPLLIIPVALCLTLIFACSKAENIIMLDNLTSAQTEKIIIIEDTPLKRREYRSLMKPKNHQEHEVIVKSIKDNLSVDGENAYMIFFYYMEDNKLKAEWVQTSGGGIYDRLYYKWEPSKFVWKLENSETGEESDTMIKTFD